jgi:hypothetical protein
MMGLHLLLLFKIASFDSNNTITIMYNHYCSHYYILSGLLLYVAELAGTTTRCMMGGKEER